MMYRVVFILLASVLPVFAAVAPRAPSGITTCYSCPGQDNGGFGLGQHSNDGTTIFCSYPADPSENPTDFFCDYSATDGHLTQDHDAGLCPGSAASSACSTRRKRSELKAFEARAAQPAPSFPEMMTPRMALAKKELAAAMMVRDEDEA
ncbi:hypothetical protein JAAARDRAFT_198222 [Jaapia argillacea MUCL 33604]|uniref:Uncharacterized protein n=1 Tax=Jaapia argillacea MUCL 33604 TaxID=933084 RepID=A0A067PCV7_9AGAM|nr:hypothetical protein JAAARDRAFT_198222 [Jaapia argillacea MUCL 33604]